MTPEQQRVVEELLDSSEPVKVDLSMAIPPEKPSCPGCGHAEEDHGKELWFDEEGIEGRTCSECGCKVWTWSWEDLLADPERWLG